MLQPSVAIVICILLQGALSQSSDVQDKVLEPLSIEKQCNGYCFSVLRPILDHFVSLKEGADATNKLRDTVKDLQSQLENTKAQLKDKETLISEKDQRIHDLQDQLNSTTARFSEISDQLNTSNELRDKIHSLEDTVKDFQNQLENTKTQLKDKENLISEKDQLIHDEKDQLIHDLTDTLNSTTAVCSKIHDQLKNLKLHNTCPSGSPNGIFQIKLRGTPPLWVPCVSSASGWAVVLRRFDGSENFNRTWNDYRVGFGDLSGEFFIGMEKLHLMIQSQRHELYIQLGDVNGSTAFASYDHFIVGSEEEAYELKSLGNYSGTAGDSLEYHHEQKFSTFDRDNDIRDGSCVDGYGGGGWWYEDCGYCSLTGKYYKDGQRLRSQQYGIIWGHWSKYDISLTFAQMMIRPITIEN